MSIVTREAAVVYRGGGRRWFTEQAAIRAAAKARILEHCECEGAEQDEYGRYTFGGFTCYLHRRLDDPNSYARRLFDRYVRWLNRCAKKAASTSDHVDTDRGSR